MKNRLITLLALFVFGCGGSTSPLPVYPKSRYINSAQSSGVTELEKATVHVASYEIWEHIDPVGTFYNEKLDLDGWKGKWKKGQDIAFYSDGNFKTNRNLDNGEPKDPSKPGHAVMISAGEGRTFIRHFWSVPKTPEAQ